MARVNMLGMRGAVVSMATVPIWFFIFIDNLMVFSSGDTHLDRLLRTYTSTTAALFMIGTVGAFFSPLAGLLQIPALVTEPLIDWQSDGYGWLTAFVCVSAIGTGMSLASVFVQVVKTVEGAKREPLPRWRTWVLETRQVSSATCRGTKQLSIIVPALSRFSKRVLIATSLAAIAVVAGVSAYVTTQPVSTIIALAAFHEEERMPPHLFLYLDGIVVSEVRPGLDAWYREESGWTLFYLFTVNVTAGSHTMAIDYSINADVEPDGVMDGENTMNILPFTTEEWFFGHNVGRV